MIAPKAGYLYKRHKEDLCMKNIAQTITISNHVVLVTEPDQQTIYTVDQYS